MSLTLGVSVNKCYNYGVKQPGHSVLDSRILCCLLFDFVNFSKGEASSSSFCHDKSHDSQHFSLNSEETKSVRMAECC